jgi:S-DNA-T family DNA segregation ATPase FtsK/SpoIIIE
VTLLSRAVTRWAGRRWWVIALVVVGRAALGLLRGLCLLARSLYRHPTLAVAAVATVLLWLYVDAFGRGIASASVGAALGALACWGWLHPETFDRCVESPLRSRWRHLWCYRREWQPACALSDLQGDDGSLPLLRRVRSSAYVDELTVVMLPGQLVEEWQKACPRLAQTFRVLSVRAMAVPGKPRWVRLWAMRADPLMEPVPVQPSGPNVDLSAVPVGRREDGTTLTLPLAGSHVLVGGETGAGKGSVIYSLLLGIAPAIAEGIVKAWCIDPKQGLELRPAAPLFDRFVDDVGEPAVDLLEQAVAGLRARAQRLAWTPEAARKFTPSQRDPLIVVIVDELAALVAEEPDRDLRGRAVRALRLLLQQGRAPGVCVVAATQDVRVEVVGFRALFPVRVALRAAEATQAVMLLGPGARERGALTDRIDHRTPGVGYVAEDGRPEPVRVRFSHVQDADIAHAVEQFADVPA